jgi:hypothetical protein
MFTLIDTCEDKTNDIIKKYFDKKKEVSKDTFEKEIFEIDQKLHEIELMIHKYCEEKKNGANLDYCKNEVFDDWIQNHAEPFRKFLNSCKMIGYLKDFLIEYDKKKDKISNDDKMDNFIKNYFNANIKWFESFFY